MWSRLPPEAVAAALFPLLLITVLTVLVFGALTVEVDAEAIRLGSGYVLWNVSGFDAVELDFASGRRFRVGTDEPSALVSALARVRGEAVAVPAAAGYREPERTMALYDEMARAWPDRVRPGAQ